MTSVLPPGTRPGSHGVALRPVTTAPVAPEPAPRRAAWHLRPVLAVGALMSGSTLLCVLLLLPQSLRLDEAQSLWQTSHSFGRMYELIAQDVHVPGYHTVLRLWVLLFGNGVGSARVLSLVCFQLAILATWFLARRVFDVRGALIGTALLALSPFMGWYGSEIRMYSLLVLVVVLNQLCYLRIFQHAAGWNWTCYALTAAAGIYTHYFFWLVLVSQALFYLANRRLFPPRALLRLAVVAVLLLVAIAPWTLYVLGQGGNGGNRPLLGSPTSVDLFNTFSQFFFGYQDDRVNTLLVATWPLAVLVALLAVQKAKHVPAEVGYFLLSGLLPIGAAFLGSRLLHPIYESRYLILSLPALILALTWVLQAHGRRSGRLLQAVLVLVIGATSLHQALSASTPVKEDYRAVAEYLETVAQPQDIVVISPPFTSYPFDYYWEGAAATTTLPLWDRFEAGGAPAFDPATLPQQVAQVAGGHRDAWLVLSYDQGYEDEVLARFDAEYDRLGVSTPSDGLTVYHFRLRYDLPNTAALLDSLNTPDG